MVKYRDDLPQLKDKIFLTDGGLETTLIFHDGIDLPFFAAITLFKDAAGRARIAEYYSEYAKLAVERKVGFILESATWRASPDWGAKLGYSAEGLAGANAVAIELLTEVRDRYETVESPMPISGCIGPRGDGYNPAEFMSAEEAERYHCVQIGTLAETEADFVSAFTMTYVEEAVGVTRAAQTASMPVVISFTVETDGNLPTGQGLGEAIEAVDEATESGPAYYMVNCAHPSHFDSILAPGAPWVERIRGIRANASPKSHAELDESTELDIGDLAEFGRLYGELTGEHSKLKVFGGCCGTDTRHIEAICKACVPG